MSKKDSVNINSDGGPVFMGSVDNKKGNISGRNDCNNTGLNINEVSRLFDNLFIMIDQHANLSKNDKLDLKIDIQEKRQELEKKDQVSENFVMRRLRNISRMAPDILEVTLATITHPVVGFGVVAKKIAEKAKSI